jgi:hypothetical protein
MSLDLENEILQADIYARAEWLNEDEGDGMDCLSTSNIEISGADDGEAI